MAGEGQPICCSRNRYGPPLRFRRSEYSSCSRTRTIELRRRDARHRLRHPDLHAISRCSASAIAATPNAVQLLYVLVSVPARDGAGVRRGAPSFPACRHLGVGRCFAVFLWGLATGLSASADSLDRGEFYVGVMDEESAPSPRHRYVRRCAKSCGTLLFQIYGIHSRGRQRTERTAATPLWHHPAAWNFVLHVPADCVSR